VDWFIPDFAMLRDRAVTPFTKKYILFFHLDGVEEPKIGNVLKKFHCIAGLATPLVLSVHTIVSFDFATSVIPGWHTTIFHLTSLLERYSLDLQW
jgi:molybdopterin-containing oxidoreductase family membrane subunit